MEIKSAIYNELSPAQRAIACFLAVNRDDGAEIDRLFVNAPKDVRHRQALLAIGQGLDTYNRFSARAITLYLVASSKLQSALAFCSAWLEAGGQVDSPRYRENAAIIETLTPLTEQLAGEVDAVRQAAREWCEQKKIPVEIFSEPICPFNLGGGEDCAQPDSETLSAVRSVFEKITLSW